MNYLYGLPEFTIQDLDDAARYILQGSLFTIDHLLDYLESCYYNESDEELYMRIIDMANTKKVDYDFNQFYKPHLQKYLTLAGEDISWILVDATKINILMYMYSILNKTKDKELFRINSDLLYLKFNGIKNKDTVIALKSIIDDKFHKNIELGKEFTIPLLPAITHKYFNIFIRKIHQYL